MTDELPSLNDADHRDSTLSADEVEAAVLADDLFLDAVLAGRASDDAASVQARVRAACDAIESPLARIGPASSSGSRHWRPLIAAAVVVAAVGLLTMLLALPSPAYATVDASLGRLETTDLTFRISVETTEGDDAPTGRRGGFQRRFDGAIIHVSGSRVVLLTKGRDGEVLARGHDGERFWSNHLPDAVESAISARGDRGIPFQRFLESIDGDLRGLLGELRGGYVLSGGDTEVDPDDGTTLRRFEGFRRAEPQQQADRDHMNRQQSNHPMRGDRSRGRHGNHAERFEIWIDDDGNLRQLRLSGMPGRDGGAIGDLVLELVDTAPLDDAIFDPATYPEVEHGPMHREGGPSRPPRRGEMRDRRPG